MYSSVTSCVSPSQLSQLSFVTYGTSILIVGKSPNILPSISQIFCVSYVKALILLCYFSYEHILPQQMSMEQVI
jgi:hypothetical protein